MAREPRRRRRRWPGTRGRAGTRRAAAARARARGAAAPPRRARSRGAPRSVPGGQTTSRSKARVGRGVGARELRVELVDHAPHLGERAVDLRARRAARPAAPRGAASGASTWNIGSSGETRRRNVCDCASSTSTRPHAGEEPARNVKGRRASVTPVVAVRRRPPPLPEHQHAPRPPREQRRRRQRADAGAEHGDVVVLGHRPRTAHPTRGRARALARGLRRLDLDAPLGDPLQDARQELVLPGEDAQAKRLLVVVVAGRAPRPAR